MKAIILEKPNQLLSYKETERPVANANEVIVNLKAAALNHRDVWITKGLYPGIVPNIILGSDGAGIVVEIGSNVDEKWLKKEVVLNPSHEWEAETTHQPNDYKILGLPENGTFAEFIAIKAKYLIEKPQHLSFEKAAALPLAGLTAYRALFTRASLIQEDRVLISGVGGGVALFAFQFAIAAGAKVYVTSGTPEKLEKAIHMGAKGAVNYKKENWAKILGKSVGSFNVIIDSAGGEGFNNLINLAAPGGRIAFYGGTQGNIPNVNPQKIFWKQLSLLGSTMGNSVEFTKMINFVNSKKINPVIDEVFSLKDAQKAFNKMEQGKQFGKIVLRME